MNPYKLAKDVIDYIYGSRKDKHKRATDYLSSVVDTCKELVATEDVTTDAAILLHGKLKAFYDGAFRDFPDPTNESLGFSYGTFWLFNALSAARVYYWIRRWENEPDSRLKALQESNFREDLYWSTSPDTLGRRVREYLDQSGEDGVQAHRKALAHIKRQCLESIAGLESFLIERS